MVKLGFLNNIKKYANPKFRSGSLMFLGIIFILSIVLFYVFKNPRFENFSDINLKNDDRKKVIYFLRKDCPHCTKFTPTWDKFIKESSFDKKEIVAYKIDADNIDTFIKDNELDIKIDGYPTVLMLDSNNKKVKELQDRSIEALNAFVK
jgi:thiol-disulfide isomerase/thioredoxin